MRPFFMTVGILAWLLAFAVMWIFAENGGALTVIAAGVFAAVAMIALGCERILRLLEDIRDRLPVRTRRAVLPSEQHAAAPLPSMRPVSDPATTLL
jgi:hypothetical protein